MKNGKRIISLFLTLALLFGCLPVTAFAAESNVYTLDNGYITVDVSGENGGFAIRTNKGNNLKKSDNNKKLLYHSSDYDTSFLSFRIDGKDYIFGGTYPGSSPVVVSQTSADGEIIAQWMLGDLLLSEVISLPNMSSAEHGMVSVTAAVTNNGASAVNVSARLLMDSYLNNVDFAFYEVAGSTVKTETVISGRDVPQNFYAVDDMSAPSVQAYVVNSTLPDSIAFGHWNRLASTLYDFDPDSELNFTNSVNDYMTADSAYAMYFNLGSIAPSAAGTFTSCYGVYSNSSVPVSDAVAVNAAAPMRLYLNDAKNGYDDTPGVGAADFTVSAVLENYESETAVDFSNLTLSVRSTSGLMPLGSSGEELNGFSYTSTDPYEVNYAELKVGDTKNQSLYFKAKLKDEASYERITLEVYAGEVVDTNLLGEKTVYILVPGVNGNIPAVTFASMTPDVIYSTGTRHLYLTVNNENLLTDASHWNIFAYPAGSVTDGVLIPHENISIKDGIMDIALTDDIRLATGSWYVQLEWTAAAVGAGIVSEESTQTSAAMQFAVSDNPKYKNNSYGILAVAKFDEGHDSFSYQIRHFKNEDELKEFKKTAGTDYDGHGKLVGTLMDIRGEFTPEQAGKVYDAQGHVVGYTNYTAISTKTLDEETRKYSVSNCITVNNCLDFEGGSMSVYYEGGVEGGAVCVEFDGELYTSDARTSVWKGKAAFTKVEQGEEYSLIKYDENGERDDSEEDSSANHITLIWPNVFGAAQSLMGMAFKMAFAQLGVMMDDEEEIGRVLSFSAQLSLSFMQANPDYEQDSSKQTYFDKIKGLWDLWTEDTPSLYQYAYNAGRINKLLDFKSVDEEEDEEAKRGVNTAVNVPDILFGCGQGFVGLHFKVKVGIANMIDALPKIEGELEVNTINDWSFGFEGEMKLEKFEMEAKLSFKSHDDIPIPDEIYFFIGGFEPGINVDGFGVLWLTGGGGGFSNLYDTIFLSQAVPPLKLCVAMSFSIVQILDGKAKMELGLTGFSLEAEDIKILGEIEVIENIKLGLEWYPGIELKAAINVNLFQGVIEGQGYIVLIGKDYTDWFFEMFARAALKIPKSIPLVGGMSIASADLGISTEKIWGAIAVLDIGIGVTYYWGESSVNFGSAKDKANPTYPSLLEFEGMDAEYDAVPIAYDEESGRTLYASFGSNLEVVPAAVGDSDLILMNASSLLTSSDYLRHKFTAGDTVAVQLSYKAGSEEAAQALAESFTVRDGSGNDFGLIFYDAQAAESWNGQGTDPNENANANVSYDSETGSATMSFTVTDTEDMNKEWTIETGTTKTEAILYKVNPLPKMDSVSTDAGTVQAGASMNVTWTGSDLSELDTISLYLCETRDEESTQAAFDGGYPIEILKSGLDSGNAVVTVPATVPTGSYYLRAVYSEEDVVNGIVYSDTAADVENLNVPAALSLDDVNCVPGGNLVYNVEIEPGDKTTGYSVTVYNEDGSTSEIQALNFDKAEQGATAFSVGGTYEYDGETYGLTANKAYKLGITPYNVVKDASGKEYIVCGDELIVNAGILPEVTTPQVTVTAEESGKQVSYQYCDEKGRQVTGTKNVYCADALTFRIDSDTPLNASVFLDDEEIYADKAGETPLLQNAASADLPLGGLAQGDHVLRISGTDTDGDGFRVTEAFTVDTLAPRLMLTSPLNGSYFSNSGKLTVSGVTDADALISVSVNGSTVRSAAPVETAADGTFSFSVSIPDYNSASSFRVNVDAEDEAGNSEHRRADVYHGGLADLDGVKLMTDGSVLENGSFCTVDGAISAQLTLLGTSGGRSFVLPQENVVWEVYAAEGNASVSGDGTFTAEKGAKGMLVGKYEVSRGAYLTVEAVFSDAIPVLISSTIGGSVSVSGDPISGGAVILTADADEGYVFDHWVVDDIDAGNEATISVTVPLLGNVRVQAIFKADEQSVSTGKKNEEYVLRTEVLPQGASAAGFIPYYIDENGEEVIIKVSEAENGILYYLVPAGKTVLFKNVAVSFRDITGHWAQKDIEFCVVRGIFNGVGDGLFKPDDTMTRAMFVTVLWNLEGCPEPEGKAPFLDVSGNVWYAKAVAWGAENGLVSGVGHDLFAPDDDVTREQMCVLVNHYIKYRSYSVKNGNALSFADAGAISSWAAGAVNYCSAADIIHGYPDGSFKPQGETTRAACCAVFHNLIGTIIDAYK